MRSASPLWKSSVDPTSILRIWYLVLLRCSSSASCAWPNRVSSEVLSLEKSTGASTSFSAAMNAALERPPATSL